MKIITELNNKMWYRFLKVIYVLIFIPIFILAFFAGYMSTEPKFDNEKSYIKCDNGKELKLSENNISLYSNYIGSYDDKLIRLLCTKDVRDELVKKYGKIDVGTTLTQDEFNRLYENNYNLVPFYTERSWTKAIGISFLWIIVATFFFELIRRTFYYIVLGSFRPPK